MTQYSDPFYLKEQITNNPDFAELIEIKHYYTIVDGVTSESFNVEGYAGIVVGSKQITFSESQEVLRIDAASCMSEDEDEDPTTSQENIFIKCEKLESAPFDYLITFNDGLSIPKISISKKDFFRRDILIFNAIEFIYKSGVTVTIPVFEDYLRNSYYHIENK